MSAGQDRELVVRKRAVEATSAKFGGKTFRWGSVDCVKVAAFLLRKLGRKVRLAGVGTYDSALGAKAALRRKGYDTIIDAVDGQGLARIAPASARMADLIAFPGEAGMDALAIQLRNGNVMMFHELDMRLVVVTPDARMLSEAVAWRTI